MVKNTTIYRVLLLVLAFLASQALVLAHQTDLEKHTASTACEECLVHGSLATPAPAASDFQLNLFGVELLHTPYTPVLTLRQDDNPYQSRGPPSDL